jgi:hypothetical protein
MGLSCHAPAYTEHTAASSNHPINKQDRPSGAQKLCRDTSACFCLEATILDNVEPCAVRSSRRSSMVLNEGQLER